jgi:tetratricopeptide (TPR) repeat protein
MASPPSIAEAYRHWQAGNAALAESICRALLAASPHHAPARHLLGMARAQGDLAASLDHLERGAATEDASAALLDDLVELYLQLGRLADAEAAARRALPAPSSSARAWHRLALVLIAEGKLEDGRTALQKVIELEPNSVEAHNNLGIVRQRLGELEAARDAYRAALALDAGNAATHANMASVLGELGQFDAALDHARRAVASAPELVGPYVYAAVAETGLGRDQAALDWLDRAAALAPPSAPLLTARAEALRRLDRAEEGLATCRAALVLAPGSGEALNTLGLLHHALGQDQQALDAFESAARHLPRPGTALANQAMVLLELGRRAEAAAMLERALALDPDLAAAWYTRSDIKSFSAGDPDIAAMERLLQAEPGPGRRRSARQADSDRLLLHYALGKAYLDAGRGPDAFRHLNAGSRLKRVSLTYDGAAMTRWMAAMEDAFPMALFAARRGAGEPSDLPIFVVGMPRSGTTLVQQILAALPGVHAAGEPRYVEHLVAELGDAYPGAAGSLGAERITNFGRRYLALATASAPPQARRIIDKMPNNFLHAGLLHLALPNAHIIHCRRNPIDTCLSCYSKLFTTGQEFSYDLAELGDFYRSYARLMAHWRSVLPPERFIEVDYEAIVAELEGQARRLVEFCGLDWDPICLQFHRAAPPVRTASMNQVRRPLYANSVGRWRAYREELGPLLQALGRA